MSAAELLLVTPDLPVERGERKSHLDDKTSLIQSELQTNCRCVTSWSGSKREPGFVRQLDGTFMWILEWLGVQRSVASFYTSMTFKLVRLPHPLWLRWHSAAPPSLHPRLQLFSPFFFFFSAQRVATSAACLDLIFPPWQLGPQCIHFQTLQSIPFGEFTTPARTVTSCLLIRIVQRSMFWEKESDSQLGFSSLLFLYIFLRHAFNCGTFGVMFNHGQLASPFSCVHRACTRAYKKTI